MRWPAVEMASHTISPDNGFGNPVIIRVTLDFARCSLERIWVQLRIVDAVELV
jgi:hypothetical protein